MQIRVVYSTTLVALVDEPTNGMVAYPKKKYKCIIGEHEVVIATLQAQGLDCTPIADFLYLRNIIIPGLPPSCLLPPDFGE